MLPRPPAGAQLAVHRARVAGWRATRGEVERWLEAVPVATLGLAPDEIFYVPRLRVRVPPDRGTGPGGVPERIISELRALLATADSGWGPGFSPGRPYRFRSRPAWQAWLIRLWVQDGSPPAREAFRASTGAPDLRRWQRGAVLRDGPALIAVIARLAEAGIAARWIASFEPADLAIAYRTIAEAFGLQLVVWQVAAGTCAATSAAVRAAASQRALLRESAATLAASGNEWQPLIPDARVLILAATTLARSPARPELRSCEFAAAVAAFAAPSDAPMPDETPARQFPATADARSRQPTAEQRELAQALPAPLPSIDRPETPSQPSERIHIAAQDTETPPPAEPEIAIESGAAIGTDAPTERAVPLPPPPVPILAPDAAFATEFGGLLFLVNAFVALGLYPDFTEPSGERLAPSPLWLADRIGRRRFGTRWRRDPLSNWIAAHSSGGLLPREWRVEPEWLHGFDAGRSRVVRSQGRTTRWHPAGFPLSDAPGRGAGTKRAPVPHLPRARSARWIACLALYLEARLRLWSPAGLGLLALRAQIETRDLELRATFALDAYPIELRLAGLDRNPGWQPAEGRSFAFVFA